MTVSIYHWLMLLIAFGSFMCCAYVAQRAQRWRDTDDGKDLTARVAKVEQELEGIKARIDGLATKSDIARVEGELNGLAKLLQRTDEGVERIESILMRRAEA